MSDVAKQKGTDTNGHPTYTYTIDGRDMDFQEAYNYLFKEKGMTAIEATQYQRDMLRKFVQEPCGFLDCSSCKPPNGCNDPEVNFDCEKMCDFYRTAEEHKIQTEKYGPYRGFNVEF